MQRNINYYKGFDYLNTNKYDKLKDEYFNPYGYNLYSTSKNVIDTDYNATHTNQNDKRK